MLLVHGGKCHRVVIGRSAMRAADSVDSVSLQYMLVPVESARPILTEARETGG
jgi:hypothetical protein